MRHLESFLSIQIPKAKQQRAGMENNGEKNQTLDVLVPADCYHTTKVPADWKKVHCQL